MCVPVGIYWACNHSWRGWIVCQPGGCVYRQWSTPDGSAPAMSLRSQHPNLTQQIYQEWAKKFFTVLVLTWCCSPLCCLEDVMMMRNANERLRARLDQAAKAHCEHCLPKFGGSKLGKCLSMIEEVPESTRTGASATALRRQLDIKQTQPAYRDLALIVEAIRQNSSSRDSLAQYWAIRLHLLNHPQTARVDWRPSAAAQQGARIAYTRELVPGFATASVLEGALKVLRFVREDNGRWRLFPVALADCKSMIARIAALPDSPSSSRGEGYDSNASSGHLYTVLESWTDDLRRLQDLLATETWSPQQRSEFQVSIKNAFDWIAAKKARAKWLQEQRASHGRDRGSGPSGSWGKRPSSGNPPRR